MQTIYNTYNEYDYINDIAQSRLIDWEEFYDEKPTLEAIISDLYEDSYIMEDFYEMEAESLAENYDCEGYFVVTGSSMGWRNLSGSKSFYSSDVDEFIKNVAGLDCEYSMELKIDKKGHISGRVSHHDSPTGEGREIYTLKEYIHLVTSDYSIKQLRAFLKGYKEAQGWEAWEIMNYCGYYEDRNEPKIEAKKHYISELSKKDIAEFLYNAFDEQLEEFLPDEAQYLSEVINYHMNRRD